jgi:23S rRNA (uridine2552-2'-O)-methyltransferase
VREVQDHWFREAKRQGYRSRAAFKLIEIDDRRKIVAKGDVVLDAGAAPGSWCQVVAKRVGPKGRVVGVDLKRIDRHLMPENVDLIEGDLREFDPMSLGIERFDTVLSDMAPDTTGDPFGDHHRSVRLCHDLLDRCRVWLRPGGNLVMKVFEGEAYRDLLDRAAGMFEKVKGFKPKASRGESVEMFVVCQGHRPEPDPAEAGDVDPSMIPVPPRPKPGW